MLNKSDIYTFNPFNHSGEIITVADSADFYFNGIAQYMYFPFFILNFVQDVPFFFFILFTVSLSLL